MKNVVLFVSLNEEALTHIKKLKGNSLLDGVKLHFIHIFKTEIYTNEFSAYVFPTDDQFPEIEKTIVGILENLKDELMGKDFTNYDINCFFDHSPKQKSTEYLYDIKADLAVVATRGKHGVKGLFSSSFTEHLVKYSPCDLYVQRPKYS